MNSAAPSASLLQHRPFVLFWLARVSGTLGLQMQAVAVGWQLYALTNDPLDLGLVALAQFAPSLLLVFIVGHAADRFERRRILCICQTIIAVAIAALAFGTAAGSLTREAIFALVFIIGVARAFEMPTMQSFLPNVAPPDLLGRAVAGSASANQFATIAGPALGGFLYVISPAGTYVFVSALMLVGALLFALISVERQVSRREPFSLTTLFAGVSYIRAQPIVLGAISLDLFAVLLGGATALLPIYARDILETGPWGLGLLRASPAIGALIMSLLLARIPMRRVGRLMFAGVVIFGVATIVFAVSRSLWLSMAALIVLGLADMVSVVIRQTLIQLETPDMLRGRVSAVNSLFIGTSNQLGDFRAGVMAALFGAPAAVLIGGVGTLAVVAIWMRMFPQLLAADRLDGRAG
jgi:MFS family permease